MEVETDFDGDGGRGLLLESVTALWGLPSNIVDLLDGKRGGEELRMSAALGMTESVFWRVQPFGFLAFGGGTTLLLVVFFGVRSVGFGVSFTIIERRARGEGAIVTYSSIFS